MARKTHPAEIQFGKPQHQLRNDIILTAAAFLAMLLTLAGVIYL